MANWVSLPLRENQAPRNYCQIDWQTLFLPLPGIPAPEFILSNRMANWKNLSLWKFRGPNGKLGEFDNA